MPEWGGKSERRYGLCVDTTTVYHRRVPAYGKSY